jgi:hypothetical protein
MAYMYPNQFARIGVTDAEVHAKVESAFHTIFFDPEEKFYHGVDSYSACMEDTGNHDARTEGMSYGMMMAVQMDRQDIFDKLWMFSHRYMLQTSGKYEGYFAWSVQLNGVHNFEGPAPDGEEYFAMALFMASARWGDGEVCIITPRRREISCVTASTNMKSSNAATPCGIRRIIISALSPRLAIPTPAITCPTSTMFSPSAPTNVTEILAQR